MVAEIANDYRLFYLLQGVWQLLSVPAVENHEELENE
jgi:hypothetical protein